MEALLLYITAILAIIIVNWKGIDYDS